MNLLAVDNLRPDMVLAKDVLSSEGRLLLHRESRLTEKNIRIFNIWGITEAWIEGGDDGCNEGPVTAPDAQLLATAATLITDAFTALRPESAADQAIREIFVFCAAEDMMQHGIETVVQRYRMLASQQTFGRDQSERSNESVEEFLAEEIQLAVLSDTVLQLLDTMNRQYSASAVAEIICRDVSLSAKILQIVNSSFYGFPRQIDSLSRAVTILGQRELQNIALGISLVGMFNVWAVADFDLRAFWRHAVGCGVLCKCLGEQLVIADRERLFLAGLLHDIGRLVVLQNRPEMVRDAICMAKQEKIPLYLAERELWGFDHGLLGGRLLQCWNLPAGIADSVRDHHDFQNNPGEAGFVHLADVLAHAAAMGSSGLYQISPVDQDVWDMFSISGNALLNMVVQARNQEKTLLNIFL
jgi:HD-like signal output (HDOD) protein